MNVETIVEWVPTRQSNIVHVLLTHGRGGDRWAIHYDFIRNKFLSFYGKFKTTHKLMLKLLESLDNGVQHEGYYE